jgi:dienelactone hydrolase
MKSFAFPVFAVSIVLLSGSLALAQDRLTRPEVSEQTCPAEVIEAPTRDGQRATAVVRKPPGKGPFPVVVLLHAGMGRKELERGAEGAKADSLHGQQSTRFLAAGYVTVNALRRGSKRDPQSPDSMADCLAVVEIVKKIPEVDPRSVVIFGHSGGGSLALELAAETPLAAVVAGEPATILFTGMLSMKSPDQQTIMEDPKRYYTPELEKLTQGKIAKISCPVLIAQGDQHPINKVNNELFIPELKKAGKNVEVITYPGQPHSFVFGSIATGDAGKKVFGDAHAFFKKHLPTQPVPLDESIIKQIPIGRK